MKFYKELFNQLRESKGLTLEDIAKATGVSKGAVWHWTREDRIEQPLPKRVRMIANLLGCSVYDISDLKPEADDPALKNVPQNLPDTIRNTPELLLCIKNAMMKKGITTDEELCKLIGYDSVHSLSRLMSGKLNWFPEMLSAVFAALEIDHDKAPISPTERELLSPASLFQEGTVLTVPIPIVDWADAASYIDSVAATSPTMRKWDPENTKTIVVPVGKRKGTFAFKIHGQSMEPLINDEDIILCRQQSLNEIPSGKVVAARLLDDDGFSDRLVCKRIKRMSEKIFLRSDNPEGEDFEVSPERISWIGLVTGKHVDFVDF